MSIRALAICLFTACSLWACTQAPPAPPADPAAPLVEDDVPAPPIEAFEKPTPAMLQAAATGDPDAMRDAIATLGTCHTATTCTGYGSCSGWSANAFCGATCGPQTCFCKPWIDPDCSPEDLRGRDSYESYRVCFNAAGQSCTEWKLSITSYCGC